MQMRFDSSLEVYSEIVYRVLAELDEDGSRGVSLAVTSAHSGAGVTYTTSNLAAALRQVTQVSVHQVQLTALEQVNPQKEVEEKESPAAESEEHQDGWKTDRMNRIRKTITRHSARPGILLIDCPAIQKNSGSLSIASAVSGVLVVIEAGRTTKEQIQSAERKILGVGGTLFGFVLNRTS